MRVCQFRHYGNDVRPYSSDTLKGDSPRVLSVTNVGHAVNSTHGQVTSLRIPASHGDYDFWQAGLF